MRCRGSAYRVQQTRRGIAVDVLAPNGTDRAALRAGLAGALAGAGLDSPEVSVEVVTELPRDPRSGKLRRFVPLS